MSQTSNVTNFWSREGTRHIIPPGTVCPEGFDPGKLIADTVVLDRTVVEVGCGVGRLASSFSPDAYVGVDINPGAIDIARRRNPEHSFNTILPTAFYPFGDVVLFYTVALHIDDETIHSTLERAAIAAGTTGDVVIAEIMDRKWRRAGNPPVFNRDQTDYAEIMESHGFSLRLAITKPYAHYANNPEHSRSGKSTDLSILVFSRINNECSSQPTASQT